MVEQSAVGPAAKLRLGSEEALLQQFECGFHRHAVLPRDPHGEDRELRVRVVVWQRDAIALLKKQPLPMTFDFGMKPTGDAEVRRSVFRGWQGGGFGSRAFATGHELIGAELRAEPLLLRLGQALDAGVGPTSVAILPGEQPHGEQLDQRLVGLLTQSIEEE